MSFRSGVVVLLLVCMLEGGLIAWSPMLGGLAATCVFVSVPLMMLARWAGDVPAEVRKLTRWTLFSFLAHLTVGLIISQTILIQYFGPDAIGYDETAIRLVDSWNGLASPPTLRAGAEGFLYLLGAFYRVFGPYETVGLAMNAAFGAALAPLVFRTTRSLFGVDAAQYALRLAIFLPAFLIWPSQLLREAPALFLIAVIGTCVTTPPRSGTLARLSIVVGSLALLLTLRAPVALVLGCALVLALMISNRGVLKGALLQSVSIGFAALLVIGLGIGYQGLQESLTADLEQVNQFRSATGSVADSGFDRDADISTPSAAASRLPVGIARVLVGPFPWEVGGVRQLPGFVDAFLWLLLLPLYVRGFIEGYKKRGRIVFALAIPAGALAILLALAIGNYGLLLRERAQVMVLVIPFMALGLSLRASSKKRIDRRGSRHPSPTSVHARNTEHPVTR